MNTKKQCPPPAPLNLRFPGLATKHRPAFLPSKLAAVIFACFVLIVAPSYGQDKEIMITFTGEATGVTTLPGADYTKVELSTSPSGTLSIVHPEVAPKRLSLRPAVTKGQQARIENWTLVCNGGTLTTDSKSRYVMTDWQATILSHNEDLHVSAFLNGVNVTNGMRIEYAERKGHLISGPSVFLEKKNGNSSKTTFTLTGKHFDKLEFDSTEGRVNLLGGPENYSSISFLLDDSPPAPTITVAPLNAKNFAATVTFSESVSLLTAAGLTISSGQISSVQRTNECTFSVNIINAVHGTTTIAVKPNAVAATRNGQLSDPASASTNVDTQRPSVALTGPATVCLEPFEIAVQFSEPVSGFTASDFVVTNATVANLTQMDGTKYLATLLPTRPGVVLAQVPANRASDQFGNGSLASNPLQTVVSMKPPTGLDVQAGETQRTFIDLVEAQFGANQNLEALAQNTLVRIEKFPLSETSPEVGQGDTVVPQSIEVVGNGIQVAFGPNGLGGNDVSGDGFYRLAFDLDGNGTFGDATLEWFRILGDGDGSGEVTTDDSRIRFDYNRDGSTNARDRRVVRDSLGAALNPALTHLLDD